MENVIVKKVSLIIVEFKLSKLIYKGQLTFLEYFIS